MIRGIIFLILSISFLLMEGCSPFRMKVPADSEMPTYNQILAHDAAIGGMLNQAAQNNTDIAKANANTLGAANVVAPIVDALPEVGLQENNKKVVKPKEMRFDIHVNNVPIKQFILGLMQNTKQNIVLSPNLKGNVSLSLKNVTLEQTLATLSSVYNYQITSLKREDSNISFGYKISLPTLQTEIFTVNALNIKRSGASSVGLTTSGVRGANSSSANAGASEASSSVTTSYTNEFWQDLELNLRGFLDVSSVVVKDQKGDESKTTKVSNKTPMPEETMQDSAAERIDVNPTTGLVIVRAYPNVLKSIESYIHKVQVISDREVLIDAKIIKVQLGKDYAFGVDWDYFAKDLRELSGQSMVGRFVNGVFKVVSTDNLSNDKFVLEALALQGRVSVLSSPRITTLNNQKAVIRVGSDEFYSTGTSSSATPMGSTAQMTSNVNLSPFFSGIALDVTPQISDENDVKIHVHPIISKVTRKNVTIKLPENVAGETGDKSVEVIPTASTSVEESDSIVSAKNKQLIIIGGLMESSVNSSTSGAPTVGDDGKTTQLDMSKADKSGKTELIILLRPTIVNDAVWAKELQKVASSSISGTDCSNGNCKRGDSHQSDVPFVTND
jgi:MSHA biogenesis protein MshL